MYLALAHLTTSFKTGFPDVLILNGFRIGIPFPAVCPMRYNHHNRRLPKTEKLAIKDAIQVLERVSIQGIISLALLFTRSPVKQHQIAMLLWFASAIPFLCPRLLAR